MPQQPFLESLLLILMSHRYRKTDEMTASLDFKIVRDPMYNYCAKTQDKFFQQPILAFLFAHFCSKGGEDFIGKKKKTKTKAYVVNLARVLESLHSCAMELLFHPKA